MIKTGVVLSLLSIYLFGFCFPCVCSETTSPTGKSNYLSTQTTALMGEINHDISDMIFSTKKDRELSKKSLKSIKKNISTLKAISVIDKNTIGILKKIMTKKQVELSLKIEQIKAQLLTNKITIVRKGE